MKRLQPPLTLSHMLSSVPDTNSMDKCSGSPLRSSLRCRWACVCPGGCRGKDRQTTPCSESSVGSLSCLATAAAARHPTTCLGAGRQVCQRQPSPLSERYSTFYFSSHEPTVMSESDCWTLTTDKYMFYGKLL